MLLVVGAGKAAPGATASAIALTLTWPRPVLLVDADPAGGDVLPGLLPGRASGEAGLLTWSTQTRRVAALEAITAIGDHVLALPEAPHAWVMPGLASGVQSAGVVASWSRIAQALARVASITGRDVIVDAGRLGESSCWPVIAAADQVLVAVRGTARSVSATVSALETITRKIGDTDRAWLLLVEAGPYSAAEVSSETTRPVAGSLRQDARAAAALTEGAAMGLGGLRRSRLMRSAAALAGRLAAQDIRGAADRDVAVSSAGVSSVMPVDRNGRADG